MASSIAAFGLDALNRFNPGLYSDLSSAADPVAYRKFIQKVESAKPGLYRELSGLQYTPPDLVRGLLLIEEALGLVVQPL